MGSNLHTSHQNNPRFGEDQRRKGEKQLTGFQLLLATFR
jgi:hypothetical protein